MSSAQILSNLAVDTDARICLRIAHSPVVAGHFDAIPHPIVGRSVEASGCRLCLWRCT